MKKWRAAGTAILYAVSALSVLIPAMRELGLTPQLPILTAAAEFLNFFLIVAYYVVNVVSEVFLYPAAAKQRRLHFLDNSLGSRFLGKYSRGYFSNDAIPAGVFQLTVNCFENCFFTFSIASAMRGWIVASNALFASVFLGVAYIGIRNNSIGLPILQIFLSALFVTQLIHHLNFTSKLSVLLEKFRLHFMETLKDPGMREQLHSPMALLLEYETILAYNKAPTSDRIYNKNKGRWSAEWDDLKRYYEIEASV